MQEIEGHVILEIPAGDAAKQMVIEDAVILNQVQKRRRKKRMVIEDAMIVPRVEKRRKDQNKYEDHYHDTCTINGSVY